MAIPIWKDTIVTLDGSNAAFNIRLNNTSGTIIYSGRCEMINNSRAIRINDICYDWMRNNLARFGETASPALSRTFCVEQGGVSRGIYTFYPNWSYDYDFHDVPDEGEDEWVGISLPIRREVPTGIPIPFSLVDAVDTYIDRVAIDGGEYQTEYSPINFTTFNANQGANGENRIKAMLMTYPSPSIFVGCEDLAEMKYVEVEGFPRTRYNLVDGCTKYVIYYINAYGGWDVLAIEGADALSFDFSRLTGNRSYNNTNRCAEGKVAVVNEITRKVTFNTGWLDNLGASRMHHLLGTTKAFLVDTQSLDITPLIMTDASWERKTHRANGMINYAISAEVAQSFIRR